MRLIAIDRSTDVQSVALAVDGDVICRVFDGEDARSADWPVKVRDFLAERGLSLCDLDRIVVGTGPGSFAGIRGGLAFAQGVAIGIRAKRAFAADDALVYGLPSAIALAREGGITAVVGDARRGQLWVAVYEGVKEVEGFRLVAEDGLKDAVPAEAAVATPDGPRIGELLAAGFGSRYLGSMPPSAGRLAEIAVAYPDMLVREPLPVYLSPAVRK